MRPSAWARNWRPYLDCRFPPHCRGKAMKPEVAKDYQAPSDLEDRLVLPLLNEVVACLHDGVVADSDLLMPA